MTQIERETMEVDVLFVGAGPATLASAIHLMNQVEAFNQQAEKNGQVPIEPPSVLVLEKSANVGDHMLSGGVMNPRAMRELVPDFEEQGFPTEHVCNYAGFWLFHPKGKIAAPSFATPPNFRKKGYHVVSLNKVAKWLAERAEAAGVDIYPGFAGDKILVEGDRVVGVRTGDMGVDKDGAPKGTYQPGMDIFAKVTVLGEGVRGTLAKQLIDRFELQGRNPQTFETGVKEIWKINPAKHKPGRVVHGLSFPKILGGFHGMWLYDMQDDLISYGFVTTLDSENPNSDPHLEAQRFKNEPLDAVICSRMRSSCATAPRRSPPAGSTAQPKLYHDGALLIGDSASMCNAQNLAGHPHGDQDGHARGGDRSSMRWQAQEFTAKTLGGYTERYRRSWAYQRTLSGPQLRSRRLNEGSASSC